MYADPMSDGPAPTSNGLVPRSTITSLVARRDAALDLIVKARDQLHEALDAAATAGGAAWPGLGGDLSDLLLSKGRRDDFVDGCRKRVDAASWNNVIFSHGFERIMDRQALAEYRGQLEKDPPVFDVETADATMRQLIVDADRLMRRGIANAFAGLDRRFRSHDGFKIGSRVVLDMAFSDGMWSRGRNHDDTIRDVERILLRLDGKEVPDRYAGVVGLIDQARQGIYGPFVCDVRSDHLRVKVFRNGNAHLWFLRDDLVKLINLALAEHYGEVLGQGSDTVEDDPLARPTTSIVRNMGWFPTPEKVARRVASDAGVDWARGRAGEDQAVLRVLEPSAGEGALIWALMDSARQGSAMLEVVAIELNPTRAKALRMAGLCEGGRHQVIEADFLEVVPERIGLFDRIVMNPPFDRQNDIAHVVHAARFLAPGGKLIAIMAASVEFRDDPRSVAFRAMVEKSGGDIRDLPLGSFEESGTMVSTCIVSINGPRA